MKKHINLLFSLQTYPQFERWNSLWHGCLAGILLMLFASVSTAAPDALITGFSIKDTNGKQQHLSDYKGKWVIVNYWATWCPPCLEEIPDLVALYDARRSKDLMVIGIALEYKTAQEVAKFVDDMLISYPIVLGDDQVVAQFGIPQVLPTSYIFNPQGKLVKVRRGLITKAFIEQLMIDK